MSGYIDHLLVDDCEIVEMARNIYGDYLDTDDATSEKCRFREISTVERGDHSEMNDSDAMLWLSPDTVAVKGSFVKYDGVYYQIEKLNKARPMGSTDVKFVKCDLKVANIGLS